jgi:two-component system response regulator
MPPREPDLLLVEDDPNDVSVALRAFRLNSLGDRVRVLRDGVELLEYLLGPGARRGAPKAILLDLKMPRMDGREALRELRAHPETRHIPVVIVSSSSRDQDVRDCYSLGANSYVVKQMNPWSPGEYLVNAARYWLELNEVTE